MSITGIQNINVGLPNESTGSDSLFDAFTKAKVNFDTLFSCASPYNTFTASSGISINTNANAGVVTITNTGVTALTAGTGIILSGSNGNITISSTGSGGNGGGTVTSVGILPVSGSRLTVTGSPIVSSGNIFLDLATTGVTAGTYNNPIVSVDAYGRVTSMSNGAIAGTVTSVGVTPGPGIQINGGPITSNGNITVTNTGVTRLTAGQGINLSSGNGNVTISATTQGGTVTSVGVSSSQLVVTGSPVVNSGTIGINLPNSATFSGNITASSIVANSGNIDGNLTVSGNISPAGINKIGGIVPGPGVNISLDGELTIDTANLPLSFGNFTANTNVLSIVNVDEDMILQTEGNAEIQLIGDVGFYKPDGMPPNVANRFFSATRDGQIRITTPNVDPLLGALEIVGSTSGNIISPQTTGAMLHVTGQQDNYSAILLDSIGNVPFFAARRFNGNVDSPTQVVDGEITMVVGTSPYGNGGFPALTTGHIQWNAVGNQTTTNRGSNLEVYTTPANSNVAVKSATFAGNTTQVTNLSVDGNITYTKTYGAFFSDVDQTNPVANTAMSMTFNNTTSAEGVSIASNSRITISNPGVYNIQFSAQVAKSGGGTGVIDIWLSKDGTLVDWTNTAIPVTSGSPAVAAWNFVQEVAVANTYFEINWSSPDTLIILDAQSANTTPTRPGIPSVILTVTPVGA